MLLNVGPQHPSTHGVLRLIVELEGETIADLTPDCGFLHTGIEKTAEHKLYLHALTLTDRIDYLSNLHNNLAFSLACEKLADMHVPERAVAARVILCELQRLASHLLWLGAFGIDLGATTPLLYGFRDRELILDIFEACSGVRMMTSYIRPGGLARELPEGFEEMVAQAINAIESRLPDYDDLLTHNPIFQQRTRGIGVIGAQELLALGVTGPILRASGFEWDLRKHLPYCGYDQYDFEVPTRPEGDCYARFLVRLEEMRQSIRIIRQALGRLPAGPYRSDERKFVLPPREELYQSMESLLHHFLLVSKGFEPPPGEVYAAVESPRGELGYYLVSDGTGKPYRLHVRAPSFANLQALASMARGHLLADLMAIMASVDLIMGDVDR